MLGKLSVRTKILIGIALGCAGWIVMMPDTSQTVEPARKASADLNPAAPRAAADRTATLLKASFRETDRIVKDTAAAALFSAHSWYVAPPPPPPAPVVKAAPVVPTAPPLPFAFMGSYRPEGTVPTYFLTAGDRVYDVKVGDTLDNTYSVDAVKSGQMLLTYMPLKIQQSLAVGDE